MAEKLLEIRQGDADTLTETISGLLTLSGYTAKLYIYTLSGTLIDTITGTISGLVITYELVNESTKAYPIGAHNYESKLFDAADHVYTPSYGKFVVLSALVKDPS